MTAAPMFGSLIGLVLLLGIVTGFWIGLAGLWRAQRGAVWWLMAIGMLLSTIGPIVFAVGNFLMMQALMSFSGTSSLPTGPKIPTSATLLTGIGIIAIPVGLILFAIGFALHGMKAARAQERMGELQQLTQAMDEEITRLKHDAARV